MGHLHEQLLAIPGVTSGQTARQPEPNNTAHSWSTVRNSRLDDAEQDRIAVSSDGMKRLGVHAKAGRNRPADKMLATTSNSRPLSEQESASDHQRPSSGGDDR